MGILSLALAALALAGPATAAQQEFDWSGAVAAGKAVEIKGVNGDIEAMGTNGSEVRLHAIKKGKKNNPSEVKIKVVEHAGGVTICAVYPSKGEPNECRPGAGGRMKVQENDVSVQFEVEVPAAVHFIGRTVNGGISAEGIQARAEAHTVNGGIKVEAAGLTTAETVNGGIKATVGEAGWSDPVKLKTVNGAIKVSLPGDAAANVEAATVNGDIETDFPLTVKGKLGRRRIQGSIGGGGPLLELETVNGGIKLNKAS
jgi:DUF4097 and DUF4098 domain-containing protein YvlB